MCLEGYLTGMAGHKAHTLWQQYTKRRQHIGAVEPLSEEEEEDMLASVRLSFHGFGSRRLQGWKTKAKTSCSIVPPWHDIMVCQEQGKI
jgi:hypothetical protein